MKQWLYKGLDKAELKEVYSVGDERPATETSPEVRPRLASINVELVPGEIFLAPDDWAPVPDPHPLYVPVTVQGSALDEEEVKD